MLRWVAQLSGGRAMACPCGCAAVTVAREVYAFGGRSDGMSRIRVHRFDMATLRWTRLDTTQPEPNLPRGRTGHAAAPVGHIVYVWGGHDGGGQYCDVLHAFDVDPPAWSTPRVSGRTPGARKDHSACALGTVVYIYGGSDSSMFGGSSSLFTDVHKLDTEAMVWSLINTVGTAPQFHTSYYSSPSATLIGSKMFVFGCKGPNTNAAVAVFDTTINGWLEPPPPPLPSGSPPPLSPEGRWCHSAFTHGGQLYVFGGCNSEQTFTDLWRFDPPTFGWTKLAPKGGGPFQMYWRTCCVVGDRAILAGGWYTPDDLHILDLSPCLTTLCKLAVMTYGLEASELPNKLRWELAGYKYAG